MAERQRTILVVDDEAPQRRLLGGFLQSLGFRIREAASAEDALTALRQEIPDMLLLDVRLPGMSGIEALAEIRRIAADLPVLLITAFADLRQAVAAMKSGADDYLSKPIDLNELEVAIADALGTVEGGPRRPDKTALELPRGKHTLKFCMGTACYVRGAEKVLDEFRRKLNVEVGQTTKDGKFSLNCLRCVGACGLAPVVLVGDKTYGRVSPDGVQEILSEYK